MARIEPKYKLDDVTLPQVHFERKVRLVERDLKIAEAELEMLRLAAAEAAAKLVAAKLVAAKESTA